ncbi:MAG: hypothetical protein RLZZ437_912 [Pseudomonadota bacterium]
MKPGTATVDDLAVRAKGTLRPATLNVSGDLDISALAIGDSTAAPVIISTAQGHGPMQLSVDLGVMVRQNGALAVVVALVTSGADGLGMDILATSTVLGALTLGRIGTTGGAVSVVADQIKRDGAVTPMAGDVTLCKAESALRQAIGTRVDAGSGHIAGPEAGDMQIAELYSCGTDPTRTLITLSTAGAITAVGAGSLCCPRRRPSSPEALC